MQNCLSFIFLWQIIHYSQVIELIVGPPSHKRIRLGQTIDLFNRFFSSTVSRPCGRPVSAYHMSDCDWLSGGGGGGNPCMSIQWNLYCVDTLGLRHSLWAKLSEVKALSYWPLNQKKNSWTNELTSHGWYCCYGKQSLSVDKLIPNLLS